MIDRPNRDLAAELVRQFLAGRINSDELEDRWPSGSSDRALKAVGSMIWLFYDDHQPRRMEGKETASSEESELLTRYAAFLDTDLAYEWPEDNFVRIAGLGPLVFLSLGLLWPIDHWIKARNRKFDERMEAYGDVEIWPFADSKQWDGDKRAPYVR